MNTTPTPGSGPNGLINPQFPGGPDALTAYVQTNLRRSLATQSGKAFVEFVVKTDGTVGDFVMLKGSGMEADQEVVRLMESMPAWTPGTLAGEPVAVKLVLPIQF